MSNAALPPSFAPPNASRNGTAHTAQNYANQFRQMSLTGPSQPTFSHLGLLHTGTTQGVMTATGPRKVSAAAMLKVEQQLGKDALDDTSGF